MDYFWNFAQYYFWTFGLWEPWNFIAVGPLDHYFSETLNLQTDHWNISFTIILPIESKLDFRIVQGAVYSSSHKSNVSLTTMLDNYQSSTVWHSVVVYFHFFLFTCYNTNVQASLSMLPFSHFDYNLKISLILNQSCMTHSHIF